MIIPLNIKNFQHNGKYFVNIESGEILSIRENGLMKKLYEDTFRGGYKKVKLYAIDGSVRMFWVHRLVIESWLFITLPEEIYSEIDFSRYTVDHINFNPSDNNVFNLRLMTNFQNNSRKKCKLSKEEIHRCYKMYFLEGLSILRIAKLMKADKSVISKILKTKDADIWCKQNNVPFYASIGNGVIFRSYEELLNSVPEYIRKEIKDLFKKGSMSVKKISMKYRIPKSLVSIICYK